MVSMLSRRKFARWKAAFLASSLIITIWFIYTTRKLDSTDRATYKIISRNPRLEKNSDKFADRLMIHPLRRSPIPSVASLSQGMSDDDNAAEKVVDFNKDSVKIRHDDNAALEEHSGEVNQINVNNDMKLEILNTDDGSKQTSIKDNYSGGQFKSTNKNIDKEVEDPESFHQLQEFQEEVHNYDDLKYKKLEVIHKKPLKLQKKEVADEESFHQLPEHQKELPDDKYGPYNNWRNLTLHEIEKLSNLGKRLYVNEIVGTEQNKKIKIHIWKSYKYIENRLIKRYTDKVHDPFEDCSLSNCELTWKDEDVVAADAVIFHMHRIPGPQIDIKRNTNQIWIWMSDESPRNIFMKAKDRNLNNYKGLFNLSMTYRMDSDIPVPYGRTVTLPKDQYLENVENIFMKKKKDIAILSSNCGGARFSYIKELQKYITIDVYGRCGPLKCPGHFNKDCSLINDYKFYVAFENSQCDDYITEKVWWNGFHKQSVPVVMGTSKQNYKKQLPPNSFIHVDDFEGPEQLAAYLKTLLNDEKEYNKFHQWRSKYKVLNEHGYFQSPVYHFCRACEALNYNTRDRTYKSTDIDIFFDKNLHCHPSKWLPEYLIGTR